MRSSSFQVQCKTNLGKEFLIISCVSCCSCGFSEVLWGDDIMNSTSGIGPDPVPFLLMSGSLCLASVRMSNGYVGSCPVLD